MESATAPCVRCGLPLHPGKAFCGNCGAQIVAPAPPALVPAAVSRTGSRTVRWAAVSAVAGLLLGAGIWAGLSKGPFGDDTDAPPVALVHPGYGDSYSEGLAVAPGVVATGFLVGDPPDTLLNFWDSSDGHLVGALKRDPGDSLQVGAEGARAALSPDGRTAAVVVHGGDAGQSRAGLWDVASGTLLRWLEPEPKLQTDAPVGRLSFSSGGEAVAGVSAEHLYQWDVDSGQRTSAAHLEGVDSLAVSAYSPDGRTIAVAGKSIWLVPTAGDDIQQIARDSTLRFPVAAFRPGHDEVLVGYTSPDEVSELRVVDFRGGDIVRIIRDGAQRKATGAYSPDGSLLVTAFGSDQRTVIRITDADSGSTLRKYELDDFVADLTFNDEGTVLFIGGKDLYRLRMADVQLPDHGAGPGAPAVLPGQATPGASVTATPTASSECLPFTGPPEDESTEHPYLSRSMGDTCREDVKRLQQALGIDADGYFGPDTAEAVKGRQSPYRACISVTDGEVGPQTWALILDGVEPCDASDTPTASCTEDALRAASEPGGEQPLKDRSFYTYFKLERCTSDWALVFSNLSGASWQGFYLMRRDGSEWEIVQGVHLRPADGPSGVFDCDAMSAGDVDDAMGAVGDQVGEWDFCQ